MENDITKKQIDYWLNGSVKDLTKAERDISQDDFAYGLFWAHLALEKF